MNNKIIISRHKDLLPYLVGRGFCPADTPILERVNKEDVIGKHVIGVIPLHLCAVADRVSILQMTVPENLRGKELSLSQIQEYARRIHTYVIKQID